MEGSSLEASSLMEADARLKDNALVGATFNMSARDIAYAVRTSKFHCLYVNLLSASPLHK